MGRGRVQAVEPDLNPDVIRLASNPCVEAVEDDLLGALEPQHARVEGEMVLSGIVSIDFCVMFQIVPSVAVARLDHS